MATTSVKTAVFPGMFDPLTHGHLDIIRRGASLYETLIVAVGENPLKSAVFTPKERVEMLAQHTSDIPNVDVRAFTGLTVEFARGVDAGVIIRGIRDTVDLHDELELALTNRIISGIETVFLMTSGQHVLTSSTLIRQIVEIGNYDIDHLARLVPLDVAKQLEQRLGKKD